jgi:2-dehydro-3-deoxygalactonokinase
MSDIALLGVDWGSSSARAFAIAPDGAIVDVRRADDGVFVRPGAFDERLRLLLGDWLERWPDAPILLCGMVGSDRGWIHAPYVAAPAGIDDLAASLVQATFGRPAHIVPGVSYIAGDTCEVMRGEETLLMGLASSAGPVAVCLPGTHTKWADLSEGRIVSFRTYMSGEVRAALLAGGALATPVEQTASPQAFTAGLRASQTDRGLTRNLFQARARRLLGTLSHEHTAAFVGGVLLGEEIASERQAGHLAGPIVMAARGPLADAYGAALVQAGCAFTTAEPEMLAAQGLLRIARRAARIGSM